MSGSRPWDHQIGDGKGCKRGGKKGGSKKGNDFSRQWYATTGSAGSQEARRQGARSSDEAK